MLLVSRLTTSGALMRLVPRLTTRGTGCLNLVDFCQFVHQLSDHSPPTPPPFANGHHDGVAVVRVVVVILNIEIVDIVVVVVIVIVIVVVVVVHIGNDVGSHTAGCQHKVKECECTRKKGKKDSNNLFIT